VCPNAVVWNNVTGGAGDVVLSGRADDSSINLDIVAQRVAQPECAPVRRSLQSVGFDTVEDLFASFGAHGEDLSAWTAGAEINTDRNLRLQYLAGSGFGTIEPELVYQNMVLNRSWPDGLFVGSPERVQALRTSTGL
jgi:spermidine synthase